MHQETDREPYHLRKSVRRQRGLVASVALPVVVLPGVFVWAALLVMGTGEDDRRTASRGELRELEQAKSELREWRSLQEARAWARRASSFVATVKANDWESEYASMRADLRRRVNNDEKDDSQWIYESSEERVAYKELRELALGARALKPRPDATEADELTRWKFDVIEVKHDRFLKLRYAYLVINEFVDPALEKKWEETNKEIKNDEHYGVTMTPIPGLVPGWRNEEGIWEFTNEKGLREFTYSLGPDRDTGEPVTLRLVLLPGGRIADGAAEAEVKARDEPLEPFFIAKYEVTQRQWKAVMGATPSHFSEYRSGSEKLKELEVGEDPLDLPVEQVSWYDCEEFCKTTGLALPTEAEWVYACSAGTESVSGWVGLTDEALKKVTWYGDNSGRRTHDVHTKEANPFGLHHVLGNVSELCTDEWTIGQSQVMRGGSWVSRARYARSAIRRGTTLGYRGPYVGVRPAKRVVTE